MSTSRLRLAPVIIFVVIIFLVSSIPSLSPPGPKFLLKDKLAHFVEYFILGVLLFKCIGWSLTPSRVATFGFLLAVGASIGALDELYQGLIPGRSLELRDWFADMAGVALGVGIFTFSSLGGSRPPGSGEKDTR